MMTVCKWCDLEHEEAAYGRPTPKCIEFLKRRLNTILGASAQMCMEFDELEEGYQKQISDLRWELYPDNMGK